jgi:hypothetical protein
MVEGASLASPHYPLGHLRRGGHYPLGQSQRYGYRGLLAAVKTVQPALDRFYQSLSDEQIPGFAKPMEISQSASRDPFTPVSG